MFTKFQNTALIPSSTKSFPECTHCSAYSKSFSAGENRPAPVRRRRNLVIASPPPPPPPREESRHDPRACNDRSLIGRRPEVVGGLTCLA